MKKLENASGNFLEMVECVQNGQAVQYKGLIDGKWYDGYYDADKPYLSVQELCESLTLEWRRKPDAFEEYWERARDEICVSHKQTALDAWNAAMEHKNDE